jgi:hypothetical protein
MNHEDDDNPRLFRGLTEENWAAQLAWLEPDLMAPAAGLLEGIRSALACETPEAGAPILESAIERFHRPVMGSGISVSTWVEVGDDFIGVFNGPSTSGEPAFKLVFDHGGRRCEIDGFGERFPPDLALAVEMTSFWQFDRTP